MKSVFFLMAALLVSGSAHAFSSLRHSCAEAQALVSNNGAVIIHTGHGTYDRYVSSGYYCATGEYAKVAWIPTMDNANCWVGYYCQTEDHGGF
ncbi:MAG: hypothetical protein ACXWQO_09760 [Bdellovibrionota bacterium]